MRKPVEWFELGSWENAAQIKETPRHVDMTRLRQFPTEFSKGPSEAWQILHWQQARKSAGWAGVSNIQEVAEYYLQTLSSLLDPDEEKAWVDEILKL
jgi:hypothetical protein